MSNKLEVYICRTKSVSKFFSCRVYTIRKLQRVNVHCNVRESTRFSWQRKSLDAWGKKGALALAQAPFLPFKGAPTPLLLRHITPLQVTPLPPSNFSVVAILCFIAGLFLVSLRMQTRRQPPSNGPASNNMTGGETSKDLHCLNALPAAPFSLVVIYKKNTPRRKGGREGGIKVSTSEKLLLLKRQLWKQLSNSGELAAFKTLIWL